MREIAVVVKVMFLLMLLPAAGLLSDTVDSKMNVGSMGLSPGIGDTTATRIAPLQQENGVGELHIIGSLPPQCYVVSEASVATFFWLSGGSSFVWVIWDMTSVPQDAEVISVEIEHELELPYPINSPGIRLQYRSLKNAYLPPPDCWIALDDLGASSLYTDVELGTSAGTRRYLLGGSATLDVAGAVDGRSYFSIWIATAAGEIGGASVPGWNANGPELIVKWRSPVAVKHESWGTLKALFFRP